MCFWLGFASLILLNAASEDKRRFVDEQYIWAVTNGYVLHASLGYFFNPLFNVLIGVLLLGEKLSSLQKVALGLAAIGCFWMMAWVGEVPWVGLLIAGSFAIYGFMRKTSVVGALDGFALETLILSPFALGYIWWLHHTDTLIFLRQDFLTDMLLVGAGSVTAVPLILFAQAARQIPLSMVGLLQYISPTCQFLLALFYFNEPFSLGHFIAFAFIWSGLAFFSYDLWRGRRAAISVTSSSSGG